MSSDPPPRRCESGMSSRPRSSRADRGREPALVHPELLLQRPGQPLVLLAPRGHADVEHVGVHRLGQGPVHVLRPRGPEDARLDGGARHEGGALGHAVADLPHAHDARVVGLSEEVPDGGGRGHHVGLVAAVGDDVVRALLDAEVLAAEVPANVHQLDRVEGAAPVPGRAGPVRALALEQVLDRHHAVAPALAPARGHVAADVRVEDDVDIVEEARLDVVGLGPELLLGDARPDDEGAGQVLALHDLLDREGRGDVEGLARVVPLAVAGGAGDEGIAVRDAGLLRRLGDAVDVGAQRDDRGARAPGGPPRTGDARHPLLDREPVVLEDAGDIALRLELLEAQLAEAEEHVDHLLGEVAAAVDVEDDLGLEFGEPRGFLAPRGRGGRRPGLRQEEQDEDAGGGGGGPGDGCRAHG